MKPQKKAGKTQRTEFEFQILYVVIVDDVEVSLHMDGREAYDRRDYLRLSGRSGNPQSDIFVIRKTFIPVPDVMDFVTDMIDGQERQVAEFHRFRN